MVPACTGPDGDLVDPVSAHLYERIAVGAGRIGCGCSEALPQRELVRGPGGVAQPLRGCPQRRSHARRADRTPPAACGWRPERCPTRPGTPAEPRKREGQAIRVQNVRSTSYALRNPDPSRSARRPRARRCAHPCRAPDTQGRAIVPHPRFLATPAWRRAPDSSRPGSLPVSSDEPGRCAIPIRQIGRDVQPKQQHEEQVQEHR